jgi:hypothetical protein
VTACDSDYSTNVVRKRWVQTKLLDLKLSTTNCLATVGLNNNQFLSAAEKTVSTAIEYR